jgi:hypothetical protein
VEALLARAIGRDAVSAIAELFRELMQVRSRWSALIRAAYKRLLAGGARYVLVGAPTGAAVDDVGYLQCRLSGLGVATTAVVLNRAEVAPPEALAQVEAALAPPPGHEALRTTLGLLRREQAQRAAATVRAETALFAQLGDRVPMIRLPPVLAHEPRQVVEGLSRHLDFLVDLLGG